MKAVDAQVLTEARTLGLRDITLVFPSFPVASDRYCDSWFGKLHCQCQPQTAVWGGKFVANLHALNHVHVLSARLRSVWMRAKHSTSRHCLPCTTNAQTR